MRCLRAAVLLLAAIAFGPAAAQTRSPADDTLESALVHWRAASWYSRLGNDDVTAIEIDSFRTAWQAVAALPIGGRPSLYAKDPQWRAAAVAISKQADAATAAADRNDGAGTAAALAQIGDLLAEARHRAGTAGFPDAVRRYRDAMDRLSGLVTFAEQRRGASFDDAQRAQVRQAAAECADAVAAMETAIPPRWADDTKLRALIRQNADGIKAVRDGLDHGASGLDIAAAINVARSNYYLLFLNYG
ncbi:MAG TPA: hypothetical protein VGB82_17435 [Alphaproteobacteria bacterium]